MGIFGLGDDSKKAAVKAAPKTAPKTDKQAKPAASQNEEAKAILANMEAKKDAGDCPFC